VYLDVFALVVWSGPRITAAQPQNQELAMANEKTVKREGKKAPVLSMKEKRAAKAAKRAK
jgi:hypothetical protein